MKPTKVLFNACLLPVACLASVAHADDVSSPTVRLQVSATTDCASVADLSARLLARVPRLVFTEDTAALAARATFTALQPGNVVVELMLTKPGTQPSLRRVMARSCAQAADAVALIIAVTVDPDALGEARAAEVAPESSAEPATPKSPEQKAAAAPRAAQPSEPAVATDRIAGSPRFGARVAGQTLFGVAPSVMPGFSLEGMAAVEPEALWSPAIVLGAMHTWRTGIHRTGGVAAFALDGLSLDLCPVRVGGDAFELRACGAALGGQLSARGSHTNNSPGTRARPFVALGGSALLATRLHRNIELWARVAVDANLLHYSFEFAPYVFHSTEPVTVVASIGVGWRSR